MQVCDSVSAAFSKYFADYNDSLLLKHECHRSDWLLGRIQLLGYVSGSLPILPTDQLREVMHYWANCLEQPFTTPTSELRQATSRWLQRKAEVTPQVEAFLSRLYCGDYDSPPENDVSDKVLAHPDLREPSPMPVDINLSAILREWVRQLATRPRWTHLTSFVPGAAPVRLTEAFRAPSLQRHAHGQPLRQDRRNSGDDELRQLLVCFEPICWLSGEPGSGKSTLLQWLVHQLIHQASWPPLLPIAIDLKSYSSHCSLVGYRSLIRFFFESLHVPEQLKMQIGLLVLDQLPMQPRCVVLLDEWSQCDAVFREQVWHEIQSLAMHHKVIITGRTGDRPGLTQHAHQLAEFALSYHAPENESRRLRACRLHPTAELTRALNELDQRDWQPTQFVAHSLRCQWDRYNVLALRADQLKASHWQVLEALALAIIDQPVDEPVFESIELERLCNLHHASLLPLLRSRLLSRLDRDPTRLQFTHPGYLLFYAASAAIHTTTSPTSAPLLMNDERLFRWTLSQSGTATLAQIANAGDRWKRQVNGLVQQATDQSDVFGHRLLRLTETVLAYTLRHSLRRRRFIARLHEAFQRPCPVEVQQAFFEAMERLQSTPNRVAQTHGSDCSESIYACLKQFAMTSFADPAIDSLLHSLSGYAWPCGQELLVELATDASLPAARREAAWCLVEHQPPMLMAWPLVCWIDSLCGGSSSCATHPFGSQVEQVLSREHWLRALRVLADAGEKTDRPWLRWLAQESSSIAIRLLALEILGNSPSDTNSKQSRAEGERCLLTLINVIDVVSQEDCDASRAAWTRLLERLPESYREQLRISPLRQSLSDRLNNFVYRPHLSRLPTVHKIAHLLALSYLPNDRTMGKRLIQACMTFRDERKHQDSTSLRIEIIKAWLAAMSDDDPEVIYEFDLDNETYRLALEQLAWHRGWLVFEDRIVDKVGTVIGNRLLETNDWVDNEIPQIIQRIAQSLPERQQADFLSYCQMVNAGNADYRHSTPDKIYQDMVMLLEAEVSNRVVDRLQMLYPGSRPPSYESWRKNLQRVQQRYQHDAEISSHLRQLGLGASKSKRRPR